MQELKTKIAAGATVAVLAGLTGVAMSSGGEGAGEATADQEAARPKVVRRTIHVTKRADAPAVAPAGAAPVAVVSSGPGSAPAAPAPVVSSSSGSGSGHDLDDDRADALEDRSDDREDAVEDREDAREDYADDLADYREDLADD